MLEMIVNNPPPANAGAPFTQGGLSFLCAARVPPVQEGVSSYVLRGFPCTRGSFFLCAARVSLYKGEFLLMCLRVFSLHKRNLLFMCSATVPFAGGAFYFGSLQAPSTEAVFLLALLK